MHNTVLIDIEPPLYTITHAAIVIVILVMSETIFQPLPTELLAIWLQIGYGYKQSANRSRLKYPTKQIFISCVLGKLAMKFSD